MGSPLFLRALGGTVSLPASPESDKHHTLKSFSTRDVADIRQIVEVVVEGFTRGSQLGTVGTKMVGQAECQNGARRLADVRKVASGTYLSDLAETPTRLQYLTGRTLQMR